MFCSSSAVKLQLCDVASTVRVQCTGNEFTTLFRTAVHCHISSIYLQLKGYFVKENVLARSVQYQLSTVYITIVYYSTV